MAGLIFSSCRNEENKIEETCFDEIRNQNELRVDCGGVCAPCEPTCDDGFQNQDEQSAESINNINVVGIDCGGENCEPCATCNDLIQNAHWVRTGLSYTEDFAPGEIPNEQFALDSNYVVYELVMETGIDCGFPCDECIPSCDDGIQNGDEEGVDCGSTCGIPCPPPTCADGVQNGTETGVDCGDLASLGLICGDCPDPTCNDGIQNLHIELNEDVPQGYLVVVETGIDCDDNPLTECPDCPPPTCYDGVQNGGELGIDCGPGCGNECYNVPNCNNGIQDGDEAGVDCDFDDMTPCPPCAACDDEVKNGPELEVDCVDYPIPQYPCPQCISCHDGIQNPETFELDVDCGGPECDDCPNYLIAASLGGSPFTDQYTFNRILAEAGNTDTLELDHNQYPGLLVEKIPGGFEPAHIRITANQGIETQQGLFIRTVILRIPYPENIYDEDGEVMIDGPVDMIDYDEPDPGFCGPIILDPDDDVIPYFEYKEVLADSPNLLNNCYLSYVEMGETSQLNISYLFSSIEAFERLSRGSINAGSMRTAPDFISEEVLEETFSNMEFQIDYVYLP